MREEKRKMNKKQKEKKSRESSLKFFEHRQELK